MTSRERVLEALARREPDRIPTFEIDIDSRVVNAIKSGLSYADFCDHMDLDAICFYDMKGKKYEPVDESKGIVKDEWGAIRRFASVSATDPIPVQPAVPERGDLSKLVYADPDAAFRYTEIEQAVKAYKGRRAVIATVYDPFATVAEAIRGEVNLYVDMVEAPDFVDQLQAIAREYHMRYVRNCIDLGVDAIWVTGDYAMTNGPMVSPKFTARFLTPGLKQIVDYCHSRGIPCLKHSDGNIWPIFDLIVETGIDGLHPIDPAAGMDIGEAKQKYGGRVCLIGGVDCAALLSWGTTEEVRQGVKEAIRKAGYGGGYVCASSNSVHVGVRPENYVAMLQAIREFGQYPLHVE
ncbi:MAG: uroporphyrinogen decarboxylase family protein [Chloroflexota bacterium]